MDISQTKKYKWPKHMKTLLNILSQQGNADDNMRHHLNPVRLAIIKMKTKMTPK
jgi:hypothetical protein